MKTVEDCTQRIPQEFSKNGNQYRLHTRGERAMIYAIVDCDGIEVDYEVFEIRIRPAEKRFGKMYPSTELFPPSEAFGSWAWWCPRLEKAILYFDQLERGEKCGHRNSIEVSHGEDQPLIVPGSTHELKKKCRN